MRSLPSSLSPGVALVGKRHDQGVDIHDFISQGRMNGSSMSSDDGRLVEWLARPPGAAGHVGAATPLSGMKMVP